MVSCVWVSAVPGGYTSSSMGIPPNAQNIVPVQIVGVAQSLRVMFDSFSNSHYIDQGDIVFGAQTNHPAAAQ